MKTRAVTLKGVILSAGLVAGIFCGNPLLAQQDSSAAEIPNKGIGGGTKMLLAGKAQMSLTQVQAQAVGSPASPATHTFFPDAFMLMPLVKVNNRLFLDAQVEVDANPMGGGAAIKLNEMIAYFRVAPCLSVFAGNFSPKYGIYMGVLDDFTNRYCTNPIGMARGPQTQTGIGIQGGIQAGYSKFNYQFYVANGPQLIVDSVTHGNGNQTGMLQYGNYADNNNNRCIGGSIGFLPLSNSNLQIDVSGQYTGKTGNLSSPYEKINSTSIAVDMNYYHLFNPIMVRVLAEYNSTTTSAYNYPWFADSSKSNLLVPSFNNTFSGWFCGMTIRPAGLDNRILSNLELGARVGGYTPPSYMNPGTGTALVSPWGENSKQQTTVCLTYWFTWKTPLNLAYDVIKETNGTNLTTLTARLLYFF
ncbi:MAG: hypothetical protein ACHQRM_08505 [Bacteroidia bacterium]